jgi:hypothetical protein
LEERVNRNPKSPLEEVFKYNNLTGLGWGKLSESDALQPLTALSWSTPRPMRSLMVDSVDFDFHYYFLITSILFATSVLTIFYLSHLFALAQLVYRERVAPHSGKVC